MKIKNNCFIAHIIVIIFSMKKILAELEDELRKNGINSQFFLVGSGTRNMVAQNEKEQIDFDYNLNIISCEDINNCKTIKELISKAINKVLDNNNLSDCDNSCSLLTTKSICFKDDDSISFSIDICIITKDKNGS